MLRKKIIQVPVGATKQLADIYGCSEGTVFNALAFRSNSEQAKLIREKALNSYDGVMTSKLIF